MNKERRKAIAAIADRLNAILADIETIRDEEQEYYDNMPESLQGGDKGQAAEEVVSTLESAMASLEESIGYVEDAAA